LEVVGLIKIITGSKKKTNMKMSFGKRKRPRSPEGRKDEWRRKRRGVLGKKKQ